METDLKLTADQRRRLHNYHLWHHSFRVTWKDYRLNSAPSFAQACAAGQAWK